MGGNVVEFKEILNISNILLKSKVFI